MTTLQALQTAVAVALPTPNDEQSALIESVKEFFEGPNDDMFFVIEGRAGTGKTFCLEHIVRGMRGRFLFTAPTNKATKVLREALTKDDFKPECRTIYSALGLRVTTNGELKELSQIEDDAVDLSVYKGLFIDEASMLSSNLLPLIKQVAETHGFKVVFLGDRAQLNPVKELLSPVWRLEAVKGSLQRVMRFDNQILALATDLWGKVSHPAPSFLPKSDNDGTEGVWALTSRDFAVRILAAADCGAFTEPGRAKAIAWRNTTVVEMNALIRARIFGPDNAHQRWLVGDRAILLEPAKDLEDRPLGSTDDEGTVIKVEETFHPRYDQFKIWRITLTTDENKTITLFDLHADSEGDFELEKERRVSDAKLDGRRWRQFWELQESFHKVRHAYAITAHRSQGSTYEQTFVNWRDILVNRNRAEAFRCLYVACSRARKQLFLGG